MNLKKIVQKVFIGLITLVISFTTGPATLVTVDSVSSSVRTAASEKKSPEKLNLAVKSAIAIDEKTGQILYQQNAKQAVPVASLSKLLTLYLVIQQIKDGKLSWSQKIKPSNNVCAVSQDSSLSNVPLKNGHRYSIRQLYQATLIYSANGAAMALAQAVAGSQKKFVDLMRREAHKLGIHDARIYTCNGLTNKLVKNDAYPHAAANAENQFSAQDMALISQKLIQLYPSIITTSKIKEMNFNTGSQQVQMKNWNWMLPGEQNSYQLLPVDGLKTGTSDAAGACFVGTTNKEGHRIITVVLGASHQNASDPARFIQTQKLMSYIYHTYHYVVFQQGQMKAALPVFHGKQLKVNVTNQRKYGLWLRNGTTAKDVAVKVSVQHKLLSRKGDALVAPLSKGQRIGSMNFNYNGQRFATIDNHSGCSVAAQTTRTVKKANIFQIGWRWITNHI